MKKLLVLLFLVALRTGAYAQGRISDKGYIYTRPTSGDNFKTLEDVLFIYSYGGTYDNYRPYVLVKFPQNKNVTTYTIPDGVNTIAEGAFQGNKYIQKIRIPSSIEYIGDNAFDDCDNLSSIEVYESSSTNVNDVFDDTDSNATEVGRYNIQGVKIQEGEDGQVQIILYSDGTSKKVVTK